MKKTLIAVAAAGFAYVGAAWVTGGVVQKHMDDATTRMTTLLPTIKITEDTHTRGLLASTRVTTMDLGALFASAECPVPADPHADDHADSEEGTEAATPPPAMVPPPAAPLLVSIKQTITHGPLPGFGLPAAASVRYEVLVNGQPVGDQLGLKTEGEMPTLIARYGFTGNAQMSVKGGAGKLIFAPKNAEGHITVAWPSISLKGHSKADLSAADYEGALPELSVAMTTPEGEAGTLQLKGLTMKADHVYPIPGNLFVYTGSDAFKLDRITAGQGAKTVFTAEGFDGRSINALHANLLDSTTQVTLSSVKASNTVLGPLHYDFTLARLDGAAYGALMQTILTNDLGRCPTPEKTAAFMQKLQGQLPALLKSGPEFRIDRISVGYEGQEAQINGKISLPAATAEQVADPSALIALLDASLTVSVPDQLIQKLAVKSMGEQMAQQMALDEMAGQGEEGAEPVAPKAPTPEQLAQTEELAKTMVAQQMEQAVANNWVVRGKDGVTSHIEYRNGAALLNGKPLDPRSFRGTPAE